MCPTEDFKELSLQVMEYCGRLPLALKILGSALRSKNLDFWKDSLRKLREVGPDGDILKKLKIGFDGLEESVQNTFLDIACFFEQRQKEHVTRILDSFDFYPKRSIPILVHKSLIHCSHGTVGMHQLIREMGRHIVRKNFPREPGKYSRLWDTRDVEHVLTRSTGTDNIEAEGILLDPHPMLLGPQHILLDPHEREYKIEMGTFRKMAKLRLLEIHHACIPEGPDYLPGELRWIDWDKYPSNYLPTTFEADILVGLRLRWSRLKQLWDGRTRKKKLKKLKYVDLSYSRNLVGTSHLGEACNLEELILQGCMSLVKFDLSIGFLKKLVCLNLAGCEKLRSLPEAIHWESLEVLNLSGCVKLQKFLDIHENMDKLLHIHLGETAIEELPSSIVHMPNLVLIDLHHCKNLVILPSTLCTLKRLKSLILSGCSKFKKLPEEMGNLECLEELLLDGTDVTEPPPSIGCLKNLKNLSFCKSSSHSPTSIFQFLFHLRILQTPPRSLVLPPIWGLTSLTQLDLTDCNLSEGVIPGDIGSLFSLKKLCLGGNNFENLPSLNQLSQIAHLELNRCKMLRELPELPSRINSLFANDCASLRVSADRLAMCNIAYGWFQNCRKLLDHGESEIVASTLLQQQLQMARARGSNFSRITRILDHIIIPGRVIPEWFSNHTCTGPSVSLKLPENWFCNPRFKGYSFFVILEVINKVKSCNLSEAEEINHRQYLSWLGLRHDGPLMDVGVELSFTDFGHDVPMEKQGHDVPMEKQGHDLPIEKQAIYLRDTNNITGLEHTILGYYRTSDVFNWWIYCRWYDRGGIEVGIRSLSPDIVVVKKWGVRIVVI